VIKPLITKLLRLELMLWLDFTLVHRDKSYGLLMTTSINRRKKAEPRTKLTQTGINEKIIIGNKNG